MNLDWSGSLALFCNCLQLAKWCGNQNMQWLHSVKLAIMLIISNTASNKHRLHFFKDPNNPSSPHFRPTLKSTLISAQKPTLRAYPLSILCQNLNVSRFVKREKSCVLNCDQDQTYRLITWMWWEHITRSVL